jgi:hypothetical protein
MVINSVIMVRRSSVSPLLERFKTRRAAPTATHNDEWVLVGGGEERYAKEGLGCEKSSRGIPRRAGESGDSSEKREAARGVTWMGPRRAGGEGITRKEPPLEGTRVEQVESAFGGGVERKEERWKGDDALRGSGVCQLQICQGAEEHSSIV